MIEHYTLIFTGWLGLAVFVALSIWGASWAISNALTGIVTHAWRSEYLIRTAIECQRRTYIRPPSRYTYNGRKIKQRRRDDGTWYQPEPDDEAES